MPLALLTAVILAGPAVAAESDQPPTLPLAQDGQPACTLVVIPSPGGEWLMDHAARLLTDTIHRWAGAEVPVVQWSATTQTRPAGPAIVLATTQGLQRFAQTLPEANDAIAGASSLDEHGFVCIPGNISDDANMLVVSRSPRGVFNGAAYLRDFSIDGTKHDLRLVLRPETRSPRLGGRAVYLLTIWGHEARYTADDWITVFDSFARDGFDRVYFWFSGHFPSRKYPQTYKCTDGPWDSTAQSGIPTLEDQRRLIRAAHERGLSIYLGGALGGWVGTRFLTNEASGTMKTPPQGAPYEGRFSLCPSSPASRQALIEYYQEMFAALPEADGVFIESADEWGGCVCERCARPVDGHGSTQFGQAQLTLIQQIMAAIWRDHSHARLAYTIGYAEHRKDPAYYRLIGLMNDPRIEWMEARDSWAFPGPDGRPLPARAVSPKIMRWRQYYALSLDDLIRDANRVAEEGLYGMISAFEPGAGTGDFYKDIPYPTDILPYLLMGFTWREMNWNPGLSRDQMLALVARRFFGQADATQLAADLWSLREIFRASASGKLSPANREKLSPIEERVAAARAAATPRAAETLNLMTRAIQDIRRLPASR